MKTRIHAIAGVVGFLTIAVFWTSTATTELFGSHAAITTVKNSILWGMAILIPAMIVAGGSGMSLGQGRSDDGVVAKKKRMPFIAMNGLLILLPSAVFLASRANAGVFDGMFYAIQGIELVAGAINLTLMGLNIRDGLRLTGRIAGAGAVSPGDTASIDLRRNGPAIVSGLKEYIGADRGPVSIKPTTALCRCGASKNKPYCDGSHSSSGFDDAKSTERTPDELLTYEGREITVHYNRLLCSKAYECGRRLERVFDTTRDPWIDPNQGSVAEIIDVVRACPSGALSYQVAGKLTRHEVAEGCAIETEKNGPYRVRNVALKNDDWSSGACKDKYSLCRCGASMNKPFCDGSHVAAGFDDTA